MSDDRVLTTGEFVRTMNGFGERIDALTEEVRFTNGRVGSLERTGASEAQKVRNLEREIFRSPPAMAPVAGDATPITRRDLAVAGGAVFMLVEVVRWLPALFAAGQGAP